MEGQKAQTQSDRPAPGAGSPAPHSFQEAEVCSGIRDGAESGQDSRHLFSLASCKDGGSMSSNPPLSGFESRVRRSRNTHGSAGEELYQAEGED